MAAIVADKEVRDEDWGDMEPDLHIEPEGLVIHNGPHVRR